MATHSSILAWRNPWTEKPGRLHSVHGVTRVRHDRVTNTFTFHIRDKELIFKVPKKHLQLNLEKDKQSKNTLKGKIFRHFTKEEIQILREYIQKMSRIISYPGIAN